MGVEVAAAGLLIAVPIAFNLAFFELGRAFDYPNILRREPDEILRRFAAGGSGLVHVVGVKFTEAPDVARRALDLLTRSTSPGPGQRPPAVARWNVLDPSTPATRESLLELVANESVLCLDDLLERRTNAWCDEAVSAHVERLVGGVVGRQGPSAAKARTTGLRTGSRE